MRSPVVLYGTTLGIVLALGATPLKAGGQGELSQAERAGPAPPSIVLIVTDDQRWDSLWAMPTVQAELIDKGITFTNAFVVNPLCCPSRVSILTGRYSHSTGIYRNTPPHGGFSSFRDRSTVATWLQRIGYRTGYFGKYLNDYRSTYVPPGWDRWFAFRGVGYYRYGLNVDGVHDRYRPRSSYSTDRLASAAAAFIRSRRGRLFVVYAPYAPHTPAAPAVRHAGDFAGLEAWRPPSYNEPDVSDKPRWLRDRQRLAGTGTDTFRRRQYETLLAVDEGIGTILRALAATRRLRNSVIVFTSDNGVFWGEHRLVGKGRPYEEAIRVPLVIRDGRRATPARAEDRLALNIDLAPTFAALARTASPRAEGRSLLPLLRGAPAAWRSGFLVEGSPRNAPAYCALRTPSQTLTVWATGEQELYDLTTDSYQLQSLHNDPSWADPLAALRPRLARMCHPTPPGFDRRVLCTHTGTRGSDSLTGSGGFDIICGRAGDDTIDPGAGRDLVFGEAGADRVTARDGRRDTIRCGRGRDSVVADRRDIVARDCERVSRSS